MHKTRVLGRQIGNYLAITLWVILVYPLFAVVVSGKLGLTGLRTFAWKKWHLSSKYFVAESARGAVFIKVNKNPSLIENEIGISQLLRTAGVPVPAIWITSRVLGQSLIVMEAIPGIKLGEVLSKGVDNDLDLNSAADQLIEIVDGLHKSSVVHRDLTPSNIIVSTSPRGGRLSLIDFSFSIDIASDSGSLLQQPRWVSARLGEGYKPQADLWDDAYAAMLIINDMRSCGADISEQAKLIQKRVGRLQYCNDSRNRG